MSAAHTTCLTVQVPLAIRRRPGRKTVVTPNGSASAGIPLYASPAHADPALVKALARAFRYQRMLDEGQYASITEMAEAERLDRGYMGRLLQLTLLAPDIVEALLDGRHQDGPDSRRFLEPFSAEWWKQRKALKRCRALSGGAVLG